MHRSMSAYDWATIHNSLDNQGWAKLDSLLGPSDCSKLAMLFADPVHFRTHVNMSRRGFGRGEYRYFTQPLPAVVSMLRSTLYHHLLPIARGWGARLKLTGQFPDRHYDYLTLCKAAGQCRPTPLLLKYGPGDYNCLHRDLYGELAFPLQVAVLLSEPGREFGGGEFVLTEQRPRMLSRVSVVPLHKGDAVVFANNQRPSPGARGDFRCTMRHGVSEIHGGERFALGIIFHDAE